MKKIAFILALGVCAIAAGEMISNVRSLGEFKILKQELVDEGKTMRVEFAKAGGIFSFDVDLSGVKIDKLVFVVTKTKMWEGVSFTPKDGKAVDLKSAEGVTIKGEGEDCVIAIGGEALEILKKGGRFQFIDAYR